MEPGGRRLKPGRSRTALLALGALVATTGCDRTATLRPLARAEAGTVENVLNPPKKEQGQARPEPTEAERFATARKLMVEHQLAGRDITDQRVLEVMGRVPRHSFVPAALGMQAYDDYPLPIGLDQTISQPYVVAFMTQALKLDGDERVLEIGTGSGYQAAVLAGLCTEVYTIEIIPELSARAAKTLAALSITNVHLLVGDGYRGWPEKAPFDGIMITAAPPEIPRPLLDQLAPGGRLIAPVGVVDQDLVLIERTPHGLRRQKVLPVRFVPMTGEAQKRR